ncbi:hypothetical protein ACFLZJ_00575 [Nanoarchaeota archaeon]
MIEKTVQNTQGINGDIVNILKAKPCEIYGFCDFLDTQVYILEMTEKEALIYEDCVCLMHPTKCINKN